MALQSAGNTHRDLGLPTRHAARTPLESRRRTSRRPFLELLEDRLAPAVLSELDGGLTLSIVLDHQNEQLTLQSENATLYDLNSTAAITDGGVTPGRVNFNVGGPTHAQVTDTGIDAYTKIEITDTDSAGSADRVVFGVSTGGFFQELDTAIAGTVSITNGLIVAGSHGLDVSAGGGITLGGSIGTSGNQTYESPVTLGADLTLDSAGGNIAFNSPVGGPHNLTLNTGIGAGTTTFAGAITNLGSGDTAAILAQPGVTGQVWFQSTLDANSGVSSPTNSDFRFDGNVTLQDVGAGTTLDGNVTLGQLTFSGYNGLWFRDVTLETGTTTTLTPQDNGNVDLQSVNGAGTLAYSSGHAGDIFIQGSVGDQTPLAGLQLDGRIAIASELVRTKGNQNYSGFSLALNEDTTFDSGGGNISIQNGILGAGYNLTLASGIGAGTTTFDNNVTLGRGVGPALTVQSGDTGLVQFQNTLSTEGQIVAAAGTNLEFDGNVTMQGGDDGTSLAGNTTLSNMTFSGYSGLTFNNVTLAGGPVTVTATDNSNVTFTGTIEGAQALTVNTSGVTTFGGAIGDVTPLAALTTNPGSTMGFSAQLAGQGIAAAGTTQLNGGTVTTAGPQTYNDAVILGADLTLDSGGGKIAFNSTFSGGAGPVSTGFNLTLDDGIGAGTTTFAGAVTNLGTGNAQALVVNNGVTGLIWFQSTLDANSGIYTDRDSPNATNFRFDGNVTLKEGTDETGTYLNGNVTFNNMTFDGYDNLVFKYVTIGSGAVTITQMGAGNYAAAFLNVNGPGSMIVANPAGGSAVFAGSVGDKVPLASLQTSGQTGISGDLMRTHGNQSYGWLVGLGGDPTFDSGGGNIDFTGQVMSRGANLTLDSGIGAGTTTFAGSVSDLGRSVGAAMVVQSGVTGLVWFKGTVTTYGQIVAAAGTNLEFDANVTLAEGDGGSSLAGNTTLSNMTFSGYSGLTFNNVTLAAGPVAITATDNSNVTFTGMIEGAQTLTVNTTGVTIFGGAIGDLTPLTGLTTDAGGTTQLNGGTVTTAGPQTYNDAVTLGNDTTLDSGGGNIAFNSTLAGNAHNLTLATGIGAGTTTFVGAVSNLGNEYDPGLVVQDGVGGLVWFQSTLDANSAVDAHDDSTPSNLRFDGNVTLGQGTTPPVLNGNVTMGPITFAGHGEMDFGDLHLEPGVATITGADVEQTITVRTANGPGGLLVNMVNQGSVQFQGSVGTNTPLASLHVTTQFASMGNNLFRTVGDQTYDGFLDPFNGNTTFDSGGGNIAFNGVVVQASPGRMILASGIGAGTTTFAGQVSNPSGGTQAALTVQPGVTGLVWFRDTLTAASQLSAAAGTNLRFDGNVTVKGTAGATNLAGNVMLNNMTFATSGPLSFGNVSLIGGPVTITSGANPLTFNGPVNGAQNLVIGTTGLTTFNGPVGSSGPLASLSTGGSGTTRINGGSVMTTGAQVYNNNVTLGANALLLSTGNAAIVFNGSVDGAYNLAASTGGATVFNSAMGAVTPLASLSTWFGGTTTMAGSEICTTGAQSYQGDVATLASKTVLMSTTNRPISFACVVNPGGTGFGSLSLMTSSTTTCSGCTLQGNLGAGRSSVLMTSLMGVLNLNGASLKINDLGGSAGSIYTIVSGPPRGVTGKFMGLSEGAILNAANNATPYRIHYTRNSVTLRQLVSTQTTLSVPPAPIHAGQRLAFSATVSTVQGAVPMGTVTFFIDGRAVRTANLVRGVAQLVLPRGLKAGSHTVKASYNGRGLLVASSTSRTIQIV